MKAAFALSLLVSFGLLPLWMRAAETHVFTDTAGRKISGEVVSFHEGRVTVRLDNGNTTDIRMDKLTVADQEYIRSLGEAAVAGEKEAEELAVAAAKIDGLVMDGITIGNQKLAAAHAREVENAKNTNTMGPKTFVPLTPNPPLSDEQFVRRAYLDIVGTVPTAAQVSEFLNDPSGGRRTTLIDRLLDSEGHASHLYNEFADMLRIKTEVDIPYVKRLAYGDWLKERIRENRPYDEIVRALLTARGKAWDGPAGFFLRDRGMPMEQLTHVMWAFLGTDISCAQCHDHPYANWTQRQFYELAVYFRGVRLKAPRSRIANTLVEETAQLAASVSGATPSTIRYSAWQLICANEWKVWDDPKRTLHLPGDYKYVDGQPGEEVRPKLIQWGGGDGPDPSWLEAVASVPAEDDAVRREVFARWLTHPQNPRFAMTIAHRLWSRAFGRTIAMDYSHTGSYLNNLEDPEGSTNPALIRHLAGEMVRVGFNLKAFLRIIYNTQAWQRVATTEDVPPGQPYYFQGPVLRRMSAEQVWDSLVTLAQGEVPMPHSEMADLYGRSMDLDLNNRKLDAKTVLLKIAAMNAIGQKSRRVPGAAPPGKGLPMRLDALNLVRASEYEQPAPPGHPLRTFGQSEREWMDSNSKQGSVPQALALMNGVIPEMVTNNDSYVMRMRREAGPSEAGVASVFLTLLSRKPTPHELELALAHAKQGDDAWRDLAWALLNTREFLFVQ